jgi:hypothetical protein
VNVLTDCIERRATAAQLTSNHGSSKISFGFGLGLGSGGSSAHVAERSEGKRKVGNIITIGNIY